MKKVCVVTCWYPEGSSLKGVFVREIAHAQAREQQVVVYHIHVVPGNSFLKKTLQESKEGQVLVKRITLASLFWKWIYITPPLLKRLVQKDFEERIMRAVQPNVINAHVIHPAGTVGYLLSQDFHLPFYLTEHWSRARQYLRRSAFRSLARKALNHAQAVVTVSHQLGQQLKPFAPRQQWRVIPNVVNEAFRMHPSKKPTVFTAISVGFWKAPKRPELIAQALQLWAERHNTVVQWVIVGEGPALDTLTSTPQVSIIRKGLCDKKQIAHFFSEADVLLHASDYETFSLVVAEALSTGLPVIASRVGAIPELVEEHQGILVSNEVTHWITALEQFQEKQWNHTAIAATAAQFSAEQIGKHYKELYLLSS